MSATVVRCINCDCCGNWTDEGRPTDTIAAIRRAARRRGWRVAQPGGVDICKDCRPHGHRCILKTD